MKKTLVALTVAAFAASSAQAVTVLDQDGTKIDFVGSLRVITEKDSSKTTYIKDTVENGTLYKAGATVKNRSHSTIKNSGSRFGVNVKHQLAEDFYALGRLEFRFDDTKSADKWGQLYAKRAYVGLGSKQYGEVTFGRQLTIVDDVSQAKDYEYGLIPNGDYIPTSATSVIRYDYRGIEGLQLSANYNFAQKNKENGSASPLDTAIKNGAAVGALYEVNGFEAHAAFGRTNYETGTAHKHYKDGYLVSLGQQFGDFKLTGDFGYAYEKEGMVNEQPTKTNKFYVSPGFQYQVMPASKVYGNYLYERVKVKEASKEKTHAFLLGVDYKFHKQVVAFVEGKYARTKSYDYTTAGYDYAKKNADKAVGVGLRVYW